MRLKVICLCSHINNGHKESLNSGERTDPREPCSTHDVSQEKKVGFSTANVGQRRSRLLLHDPYQDPRENEGI